METRTNERGETEYKVGRYWLDERDVCHKCLRERAAAGQEPREAEPQHSGGIYAGRMCEECFRRTYRQNWEYDYLDAGEYLDAEDY